MSWTKEANEWIVDASVRYHLPNSANGQRFGQWMMNALHDVRPDLYTSITGTDVDPFYDDERMNAFCEYLALHWLD